MIQIKPLIVLLQWIFEAMFNLTDNYGVSLILLSIIVNIILIPVYYPIEKLKKRNKEKQKDMDIELEEIKEMYKGQERFYYVNALHRQYKFNPLKSLIPSLGLLIQIPFFMAAYEMLSKFNEYTGHSFLFINDLSLPDGSIDLGYSALNLLPVIMTILNVVSSLLYTKDSDKKERYQLWSLAAIFLVVLYKSPAALVLYWTMNNIFALVKQVFENRGKRVNFKIDSNSINNLLPKIFYSLILVNFFAAIALIAYNDTKTMTPVYLSSTIYILFILLQGISIYYYFSAFRVSIKRVITFVAFIIMLFLQIVFAIPVVDKILDGQFRNKIYFTLILIQGVGFFTILPYTIKVIGLPKIWKVTPIRSNLKLILLISSFISSLIFLWIPIQVYSSMPSVFHFPIFKIFHYNGLQALVISLIIIVFYLLVPKKQKPIVELFITYCGVIIFIYAFFINFNFGALDGFILSKSDLLYGKYPLYIVEFLFLSVVFILTKKLFEKKKSIYIAVFALLNVLTISQALITAIPLDRQMKSEALGHNKIVDNKLYDVMNFSADEENVLVIMSDMFQGTFIKPIIEESPELKKIYSGFTWYPNTLSNSFYTNASLPGLMAGWDFTPQELNKRDGKNLVSKISSSYEYMINKAQSKNMDVSIVNPSYYLTPKGDLKALGALGVNTAVDSQFLEYFEENISSQDVDEEVNRLSQAKLLSSIGLFRGVPFTFKNRVYNQGKWINLVKSNFKSVNKRVSFLKSMPHLAKTTSRTPSFKFFNTEVSHSPFAIAKDGTILKSGQVDTKANNSVNGLNSYYSAYWTIKWFGEFITWLKDNGIYDNTKIILVSDHGNSFNHPYMVNFENTDELKSLGIDINRIGRLNPLLLVKDFNASGDLKIDERLMSNVDTHDIAFSNSNPHVGPYDKDRVVYSSMSNRWANRELISTNTYNIDRFYEVKGSIFDLKNWSKVVP